MYILNYDEYPGVHTHCGNHNALTLAAHLLSATPPTRRMGLPVGDITVVGFKEALVEMARAGDGCICARCGVARLPSARTGADVSIRSTRSRLSFCQDDIPVGTASMVCNGKTAAGGVRYIALAGELRVCMVGEAAGAVDTHAVERCVRSGLPVTMRSQAATCADVLPTARAGRCGDNGRGGLDGALGRITSVPRSARMGLSTISLVTGRSDRQIYTTT